MSTGPPRPLTAEEIPALPASGAWYARVDGGELEAFDARRTHYVTWYAADVAVGPGGEPGGLTAEQLRAAGIDPADVVDVVAVPAGPPVTSPPPSSPLAGPAAIGEAWNAANASLWKAIPSHLDELLGRAPSVGLIRDHQQPWRTIPAALAQPGDGIPKLEIPRPAAVLDAEALAIDARVMLAGPLPAEEGPGEVRGGMA